MITILSISSEEEKGSYLFSQKTIKSFPNDFHFNLDRLLYFSCLLIFFLFDKISRNCKFLIKTISNETPVENWLFRVDEFY